MSWRRGFFRLWVLGTCCWASFWLFALQDDLSLYVQTLIDPNKIVDPFRFPSEQITRAEALDIERSHAFSALALAFLPPAIALVIGVGVAWAVAGFRSKVP